MADGDTTKTEASLHAGIIPALIAAQKEFPRVEKIQAGQTNRGKYAPYDHVLALLRPVLNRHGIVITQPTAIVDGFIVIRTKLVHVSGEEEVSEYPACAMGKAPQETGSAVTYAKRYALLALCGVHPTDEDDDGEKGAKVAGRPEQRPAPRTTREALSESARLESWIGEAKGRLARAGDVGAIERIWAKIEESEAWAVLMRELPNEIIGLRRAKADRIAEIGGRKSSAQAKRDGDWQAMLDAIGAIETEAELDAWWDANKPAIDALPNADWRSELIDRIELRRERING